MTNGRRWVQAVGIVLAVLCGPGARAAQAQGAGVLVGFATSTIDVGTLPAGATQTRFSGWTGGAFVGFGPDRIGVSIEGVFTLKGSRFGASNPAVPGPGELTVAQLAYFSVPILVRVRVATISRRPFMIVAGPSFGVIVRARDISHSVNLGPLIKKLDRALVVGAGLEFGGSFGQVRYEWSLQNLAVGGGVLGTGTTKNRSLSLVVGARF